MEQKEDINALDEIHKGACMGIIEERGILNNKEINTEVESIEVLKKYL